MQTQLHRHCDCRTYAPVDVAKGICHRTKELVAADGQQCEHYVQLPKCRFCSNYTPSDEEFIGTCNADPGKPWTYPDLIAVTCESFKS